MFILINIPIFRINRRHKEIIVEETKQINDKPKKITYKEALNKIKRIKEKDKKDYGSLVEDYKITRRMVKIFIKTGYIEIYKPTKVNKSRHIIEINY